MYSRRQTDISEKDGRDDTRRDLGGTLITTQVQSSKLYIPNCKKKLLADEESTFHSDYFLKKVGVINIPHLRSVQNGLVISNNL